MKIQWRTSDSVTVDMDGIEYQSILIFLTLLQVSVKDRPNLYAFLSEIQDELYEGWMAGIH